jgi:ATP-dependent RNA helicase DDX21
MQLLFLLLSILPILLSSFRLTKVKYTSSSTSIASTEFSVRSYSGGRAGSNWNRDDRRPQRDFGDRGGSRYSDRGGGYGGRGGGGYGGRGGRPRMDQTATLRFANTIKIDPNLQKKVDEMGFSEKTLRVLKEKGFESLTPVQTQSYSIVYEGQDVVARSRTGTGKTFAFGLPLVEKLVADGVGQLSSKDLPLVLVLEPTRELCIQVAHELGTLCSAHRLRTQAIYGGASFSMQERAMRSGVHIIVATPGRCLDHISRGTLKLENVKHVVLDEGDTMLEMGFQKDVESIIANVKSPGDVSLKKAQKALQDTQSAWRDRDFDDSDEGIDEEDDEDDDGGVIDKKGKGRDVQMLLYSATMPGWICKLTDKHMIDPTFLDAVQEGETRLAQTIEHVAIRLPPIYDRVEAVSAFAEDILLTKGTGGQTIVFTNTKEEADRLAASDCFGQFKTQVIHGDIGQNSRQTIIKQFREKKIEVLVATDVAARGLDIAGVDLVVHVSPPMDADTYVHRSGRTGRAGRNGTSVMLYTENESRKLNMYENSLNFKFVRSGPPSANQISEACATFASKRLENVDKNTVKHFLPHAKRVIDEVLNPEVLSNEGADVDTSSPKELIEFLLAKCIAAISNRQTITSRYRTSFISLFCIYRIEY